MSAFEDDERFDGLYLNVAQTTRGIEPLLDTVFSFLRRKTDFFAGPPGSTPENGTVAAMAKVEQVMQKHAQRYQAEHKPKPKTAKSPPAKKAATKPKAKPKQEEVIEMGQDGGFDVSTKPPPSKSASSATTTTTTTTKTTTKEPESTSEESSKPAAAAAAAATGTTKPAKAIPITSNKDQPKDEEGDDNDNQNKDPPPLGNGGTNPGKYVWTQTLAEVTVTIPVPENTRGRDLNVTIQRNHLKVGLKSASKEADPWIVNDPLCKTIICDDSFWTVEDGNRLVLQLQKLNPMEWWNCVCQGGEDRHPTINVQKIQPENSSLGDLDGETRKTVEKMMFDQRQTALGLPTSDEQTKLTALETFKLQHPEMDFSNAKIT